MRDGDNGKVTELRPRPAAGGGVRVEGEIPERLPRVGSQVWFTFGDPHAIGGDLQKLHMTASEVFPGGRLSGCALTNSNMMAMGPDGRPMPAPPELNYRNVPYSATPRPLTWRWPDPEPGVCCHCGALHVAVGAGA